MKGNGGNMDKDTILAGLAITGAIGLVSGLCVHAAKETQKLTDYKNLKRKSIESLDLYLYKMTADDGYTARYCYEFFKSKLNSASTVNEVDSAVFNVKRIVELVKDGSTSSIVELRLMKDKNEEEKKQKRQEDERRRQQQMIKDFANALNAK